MITLRTPMSYAKDYAELLNPDHDEHDLAEAFAIVQSEAFEAGRREGQRQFLVVATRTAQRVIPELTSDLVGFT